MHVYKNEPIRPKPHESMELTQKAGVNIRYNERRVEKDRHEDHRFIGTRPDT